MTLTGCMVASDEGAPQDHAELVGAAAGPAASAHELGVGVDCHERSRDLVEIAFPPGRSATDDDRVRVRGTARAGAGIVAIEANGLPAQSDDGFANWSVEVPLALGYNDIEVKVVRSEHGDLDEELVGRLSVGRSFVPGYPVDLELDEAGERLLSVDLTLDTVFEVDLATGVTRVISSPERGSGPALRRPEGVARDLTRERVLVVDSNLDAVVAVDLATGDRAILSDANVGSGPVLTWPLDIVIDADRNRALVVEYFQAVIAIDLDTGDRSVVSDASVGAGTPFGSIRRLAMDPEANRVLVSDRGLRGLMAVDLDTGDRTIVSPGEGSAGFPDLSHIVLDRSENRALVFSDNPYYFRVMAVDLDTGTHTELASSRLGDGPLVREGEGFAYDRARGRFLISDANAHSIYTLLPAPEPRRAHEQKWGSLTRLDVGAGPRLYNVEAAVMQTPSRALVTERGRQALLSVNLRTGERREVLGEEQGLTESLRSMNGLDLLDRNRVLIGSGSDEGEVRAFHLRTGEETVISTVNSPGPYIEYIESVLFDDVLGRILLLSEGDGVFAVDPDTGVRTQVSGDGVGEGRRFGESIMFALDRARNRLLVTDEDLEGLQTVDLSTGDRGVIFEEVYMPQDPDGEQDDNPDEADLGLVTVDEANEQAVAVDRGGGSVFILDLVTGEHSVLTSRYHGLGPVLRRATAVFIDSKRDQIIVVDRELGGLIAVDRVTGDRVVISR
ncbi:hypothetical protein [Haliangium sp.]|uniref:hypothetical protein n=1 Tax=Haliangium sp. TaxID=2663208 RepID=UPI003D124B0A